MALSPAFTVAQNPLTPANVLITDTSTGSDGAITQRRVYVTDYDGTYYVPPSTTTNYTQWDYADASINLVQLLTKDTAASIQVDWLDVSDTVLYTLTQQYPLAKFEKQFLYYLVQLQGLTPSVPIDTNYNANVAILWTCVLGGINAVENFDDIAAGQNCFDRGTYMILNQDKFF